MCGPYESLSYPVDTSFRLLGRRWAPEIMISLMRGTSRYSELARALPGMSTRTLSLRISELQEAGVIAKTRSNRVGVSYELTEKGRAFMELLESIAKFTIDWHSEV